MNASTLPANFPTPLKNLLMDYFRVEGYPPAIFSATCLAGDGSDRTYFRIKPRNRPETFIAVEASAGREKFREANNTRISENHSFMYLAKHLAGLGFPIPRVLASSLDGCYYVLDDLGNTTLYDLVQREKWSNKTLHYYHQTLKLLINLQQKASKGFDPSWCYAGGYYDRELIIARELEYFLHAFATPLGHIKLSQKEAKKLSQEFVHLANLALEGPCNYFLYRDYQSKNLMIKNKQVWLIDFQGARLGPPYYDLASVINDPYVAMPLQTREQLLNFYYDQAAVPLSLPSRPQFNRFFAIFSLIRGLQVLGAFGFLSEQKKRLPFRSYIPQALADIKCFAADPRIATEIPTLGQLIATISYKG